MFDIKLYDEGGERETIRGLSWSQMATVQSVLSRLHFIIRNKSYKHISKQVSDENEIAALRAENAKLRESLSKIRMIASCAPHDDEELASQEFHTIMNEARRALESSNE